jgi:hypothetical protein
VRVELLDEADRPAALLGLLMSLMMRFHRCEIPASHAVASR